MGDVQFLPGCPVLLEDEPGVQRLSDVSSGEAAGVPV
jgi:hypothetical protein